MDSYCTCLHLFCQFISSDYAYCGRPLVHKSLLLRAVHEEIVSSQVTASINAFRELSIIGDGLANEDEYSDKVRVGPGHGG